MSKTKALSSRRRRAFLIVLQVIIAKTDRHHLNEGLSLHRQMVSEILG